MVIRVEQGTEFEAIPSIIIMPGKPQFDPFHKFKNGQEWRVGRRKVSPLPRSLDHYTLPNRIYRCGRWVPPLLNHPHPHPKPTPNPTHPQPHPNSRHTHEMWSECFPVEMCFNEQDKLGPKKIGREPSIVTVGTHHHHLQNNSKVLILFMPCKFSNRLEQNFIYCTEKLLSLH